MASTGSRPEARRMPGLEWRANLITAAGLKCHLDFLGSDRLLGRRPGTAEFDSAGQYAVSRFREAGLKPVFRDMERTPTFQQVISYREYRLGSGNAIRIVSGQDQRVFLQDKDYLLMRPGVNPNASIQATPVYLGYGLLAPEYGWDDLAGQDITGRIVIIETGAPSKNGKPVLPNPLHAVFGSFVGILPKVKALAARGAAGIIIVAPEALAGNWEYTRKLFLGNIADIRQSGIEGNWLMGSKIPVILTHPRMFQTLFGGTVFEELTEAEPRAPAELRGLAMSIEFDVVPKLMESANVVACLPGTDPVLKNEFVAIGAHLDHLGVIDGKIYAGADDDASGCAAVLEIAAALAKNRPKRSTLFILFTLEEAALLGSGIFVETPPVPLDKIVAYINLEILGGLDERNPDSRLICPSDFVLTEEGRKLIEDVNKRTQKLPLRFSSSDFAGADYFNFYRHGIPILALSSPGTNGGLHTIEDTLAKINIRGMEKIARLVYEVIRELGNRAERPILHSVFPPSYLNAP